MTGLVGPDERPLTERAPVPPPPTGAGLDVVPATSHTVVLPASARPDPASLAEVVAAAALAVPGVLRLHGGRFGLGTYLPGRRVTGVRIGDDGTEVHVVVTAASPVQDTAARVQRAVSAIAPMPVHVHVEDLDVVVPLVKE